MIKAALAADTPAQAALRSDPGALQRKLRGIEDRLESLRYLDGSAPAGTGSEVYAASLRDAGAIWDLYLEDSAGAPSSFEEWGGNLQERYRRLRGFLAMRRAAWGLDFLLKPVSWMLPCPSPFQRRLLRRALTYAFRDTAKLALIRDMGQSVDSTVTASLAPMRASLPRTLANFQFGRRRITAEDHRAFFSSYESFSAHIGSWMTSGTNPVSRAFRQPETVRWLYEHAVEVIRTVPEKLLSGGVFGKLCRSLFGVVAFKVAHLPQDITQERLDREIFESVQAGFHFGRTYLFDEIQDLDEYPAEEKRRFLQGVVDLLSGRPSDYAPADPTARMVMDSLLALRTILGETAIRPVYNAYLALAQSQIQDRGKAFGGSFGEREIYGPLMVKSAYTRILPALIGRMPITSHFIASVYLTALPNQLIDDFRDLSDDLASNTFTPYTHLVRGGSKVAGFRHPLEVYLRALGTLVRLHDGHPEVRRLWANRFVHGLRVFNAKGGEGSLRKFLTEFPHGGPELEALLCRLCDVAEGILDAESILASIASNASMNVRGFAAKPVVSH